MDLLEVRLLACKFLSPEVALFTFGGMGSLPAFQAGAHIDVEIAPGCLRQYSLIGTEFDTSTYQIAVKRETNSRGGSAKLHELAQLYLRGVPITLRVGAPRNNFPVIGGSRHILLGAGIGITPLLSMARALYARGASFSLDYFVKEPGVAPFEGELSGAAFWSSCTILKSRPREEIVARVRRQLVQAPPGARFYACGPTGFLDVMQGLAGELGLKESLSVERFAATETPGKEEEAFAVRLHRRGIELRVSSGETILDVLERAGVCVPASCRQGICGTCITNVLSGTPDHRDQVLSEHERQAGSLVCVCVSRSASSVLTLDL